MPQRKILALSSSKVGNSVYLEPAVPLIKKIIGDSSLTIAFIPFAAVNLSYTDYAEKVEAAFQHLTYNIITAEQNNAYEVIANADVIMVGGGNSFKLLHDIYKLKLADLIKEKVNNGAPYIGWSAGSNLTSPGIYTSNDMPIIEPESLKAFGFFSFQLNPHYYNYVAAGFNGETRDQRLEEFMQLDKDAKVLGLPEGTAIKLENEKLEFLGSANAVLFFYDDNKNLVKKEISPNQDISFLLS